MGQNIFSKALKSKIKEEWIDLNPVFEKAVSISRGQLKEKKKTVITNIPENFPQVWSDPFVLEQILINLLINAIQAVEHSDPRIELNVEVNSNWLNHIIFEVKDNGHGMDEKTIQKIFNPFFTTKLNAKGTGLGLYVTQNLVASLSAITINDGSVFKQTDV